jgi:SAM-dependent methyltransferase
MSRAEAYQRSFAPLCAHPIDDLLDLIPAPAFALDVGSGAGAVADRLRARGSAVIASDANPGPGIIAAALPNLPFRSGAFDAAAANFVVNHLTDPLAGVREMVRVTRTGGHLAVSIWAAPAQPLQQLWNDVMAAADITPAPPTAVRDFPRTPEGLVGLLRSAGLSEVAVRTVTWNHVADPDEWWLGPVHGLGGLGYALRGDPRMIALARREYDRIVAARGGIIDLETTAVLAAGTV